MATKKRLSDLVREEVKKQAEDGAPAAEAAPKKVTKTTASSKRQTSRTATKKTASQTKKSATSNNEVAALKAKLAALEKENQSLQSKQVKLTSLEQENQALQADNAKLLSKVESLEQSVITFKTMAKDLKAAQSKQKSMQLTLDEAKQDALKLAQENQKLLDKIKDLEAQSTKGAAIAQRQPSRTRTVNARPIRPAGNAIQRSSPRPVPVIYKAPAKKPFSRPISPSRLPTRRVVQNPDEFETWCYD